MIDYTTLLNAIKSTEFAHWAETLPNDIAQGLNTQRHGDLKGWYQALDNLPQLEAQFSDFKNGVCIGKRNEIDEATFAQLDTQLRALIPWRKGPYNVFGVEIDTEWRSDWKWDRVIPHLSPLKNKRVLDIGCGNGYHCWRMLGAGAARVIGIDPSPRFVVQFYMLKKLLGSKAHNTPVDVLPIGIEALPEKLQSFDTTFSMGVLYHRRSPMDHLKELMDTLKPGGELVLETLVINGELGECLVPEGRYAKMNNVWFLPSVATLVSWMKKLGYENAHCVDINTTNTQEQRSTDWMKFHSLPEFLHKEDSTLTAEGHPAPVRAIVVARKPKE